MSETIIIYLTAIASLITALAAIFSPIITTYLQNRAAYKLQTLEMFFTAKSEAYSTLISALSHFTPEDKSPETIDAIFQEFDRAMSHAALYSTDKTRILLSQLGVALYRYDCNDMDSCKLVANLQAKVLSAMHQELHEHK